MFNKEAFAYVLGEIRGKRSTNQFARDTGVDGGYISRMMRMKLDKPPGASIIGKLAKGSALSLYEKLMMHAGYSGARPSETPSSLQMVKESWLEELAKAPKEKRNIIRQIWEIMKDI